MIEYIGTVECCSFFCVAEQLASSTAPVISRPAKTQFWFESFNVETWVLQGHVIPCLGVTYIKYVIFFFFINIFYFLSCSISLSPSIIVLYTILYTNLAWDPKPKPQLGHGNPELIRPNIEPSQQSDTGIDPNTASDIR